MLGNDGIQNGNLGYRVEVRSALENQIGAHSLGGGFGTLAHGDVECVGRQAGHKCDGEFLVCSTCMTCGQCSRSCNRRCCGNLEE
jgi:hypothetical protein